MNIQMKLAIEQFFDSFEMDADRSGHTYKMLLREAVTAFLEAQDKDSAYTLYSTFFDIYKIGSAGKHSFVDLLDVLRSYEENAAQLIKGQRDHYIHSANVFVLGLFIYASNRQMKGAVDFGHGAAGYEMKYSSHEEEFLLTWGITALFHDIGYPMEIVFKQIQRFVSMVAENDHKEIGAYVSYFQFDKLNHIRAEAYFKEDAVPEEEGTDTASLLRPTDLIAHSISRHLEVDPEMIRGTMAKYLETMQKFQFVDHGFYSALIVLKWYGEYLLQFQEFYHFFYTQIADCAAAILLHNAYKGTMQKPPYELTQLDPKKFPLAYMIILCDEAQEWHRQAYGDEPRAVVDDSQVEVSDRSLHLHYITSNTLLKEGFCGEKEQLLNQLLDVGAVFPEGIRCTATGQTDLFIASIKKDKALPRLLINNIEQLARMIHEDYNKQQLNDHPDQPLQYPTWESLPDTLKFSNVRQAQNICDKLRLIGCYAAEIEEGKTPYEFTEPEIEYLARYEHDSWMLERTSNGWIYGPEKNVDKKISPYIVPYEELTEEIKDLDRDTIRNIPNLLKAVGLAVYRYW